MDCLLAALVRESASGLRSSSALVSAPRPLSVFAESLRSQASSGPFEGARGYITLSDDIPCSESGPARERVDEVGAGFILVELCSAHVAR